jgi:hypothetical protein
MAIAGQIYFGFNKMLNSILDISMLFFKTFACFLLYVHKILQICLCCLCWWDETMSLSSGHQQAYCSSPRWYMSIKSHGGMILTGKTEEHREKPVPVPRCPPQIPHGLTHVWTQASTVRGWQLTAWPMVQAYISVLGPLYKIFNVSRIFFFNVLWSTR